MILKRLQVKTPQVGLLTNSYIICDEKTNFDDLEISKEYVNKRMGIELTIEKMQQILET